MTAVAFPEFKLWSKMGNWGRKVHSGLVCGESRPGGLNYKSLASLPPRLYTRRKLGLKPGAANESAVIGSGPNTPQPGLSEWVVPVRGPECPLRLASQPPRPRQGCHTRKGEHLA